MEEKKCIFLSYMFNCWSALLSYKMLNQPNVYSCCNIWSRQEILSFFSSLLSHLFFSLSLILTLRQKMKPQTEARIKDTPARHVADMLLTATYFYEARGLSECQEPTIIHIWWSCEPMQTTAAQYRSQISSPRVKTEMMWAHQWHNASFSKDSLWAAATLVLRQWSYLSKSFNLKGLFLFFFFIWNSLTWRVLTCFYV